MGVSSGYSIVSRLHSRHPQELLMQREAPDVLWHDSIAGSSRAAEEHASRVQLLRLILVEGSRHDFIRERLVS